MTVEENLEMGAFGRQADSFSDDIEKIYETFPILKERRKQLGGNLSGGEQQMLAIARALMARPRLLLLDEPSMGLAPMIVETIFRIIGEIRDEGTTVFLVEQNAAQALRLADRGYVMENGRIVFSDTAANLLHDERVRAVYLGESVDRRLARRVGRYRYAPQRVEGCPGPRGEGRQGPLSRIRRIHQVLADAAAALQCEVGAIASCLVFMLDDEPVVVIKSGAFRVDTKSFADLVGGVSMRQATADEVRAATGQPIGGVSPVNWPGPLRVYIDDSLARYERIWSACGTPNAVFATTYEELSALTNAEAIMLQAR